MTIEPEATTIINDFVDRVRLALPLSPSTRLAAVDRLYHDIISACADKAQTAGLAMIDADTARAHLATLGTPEACASALASAYGSGTWQWPGDYFAEHLRAGSFEEFARSAAEKGEQFAGITMDSVASALDIAARKLREAAERLKTRQ